MKQRLIFIAYYGYRDQSKRSIVTSCNGHKPKSRDTTEAHYKVRTIGRLRDKHIEFERWILEQAGIVQPKADERQSILAIVR